MPAIEGKRVVLAVLELTDSTIRLMKAASHREISSKQLIDALKSLVARERQTVRRQNKVIEDLRRKHAELEQKLEIAQQRLRHGDGGIESMKEEDSDGKINLPSLADLQRLDIIPRPPDSDSTSPSPAAQTTLPPLYELQRCYSRLAEQYAVV